MPGYAWLTFAAAQQQLAQRLNVNLSASNSFWSQPEIVIYIQQALRTFNALTFTWKSDFTYSVPTTATSVWNSLGSLTGSPRLRTITDTYCYMQMEYMLLEPATGGTWTGTSQFTIAELSQALQTRRDEMIQVSNCNQVLLQNIGLTPGTTRTYLPDTTIDVARARYIPVAIPLAASSPTTLYRDDTVAQEFYEVPLYQQTPGAPQTFSLSSEPPLSFDVDIPPNQPGVYEAVVSQTGTPFNPPASTLLGIPDDFVWVLIWGALADLLGRESEATDRLRSAYCLKRYQDGLNLLLKTPWIMLGKVNGAAVSVDSLFDMDRYSPEWDSNPTGFGPVIVTAGMDFLAAPLGAGIGVTCLGNAPVPVNAGDYVQVSRSDWDIVLDFAQCFAAWKQGGAEFQAALELESRAIQACAAENSRLRSMGAFSDILVQRGQSEERSQNRYNSRGKNG